jgi:phenylpropionate dioxygenase-like ring-hydroxylating dioxygenase large terminal subunit
MSTVLPKGFSTPLTSFSRLPNGEELTTLVRADEGVMSRRIYADPDVHALEAERVFGRAWFFLGHDSEIPNPGDMVSRQCGLDPVVLLRDDDGIVRAFLNSCRHRGMRLCRTDRENVRFLRCPYHGWSYQTNGELLSASSENHYGEGELVKEELGLIPVAKLGSHQGFWFATWDPDAPSFEDWLGDMRWYMDTLFGRTGGIEFIGVPQIWDAECSWKFATENFTDNFHVFWAHQSLVELKLLPDFPDFAAFGTMIHAGNGHILHFTQGDPHNDSFKGLGLPKDLWPLFGKHLNPVQQKLVMDHGYSVGTIWPNFHWLQLTTTANDESTPVALLNLRLEIPISPTRTRMYSWFAIDKAASPEYRKHSYETYVRTFGPGGIFDQDDMENWEECTSGVVGPASKRHALHHKMGLHRPTLPDFPGPGTAWDDGHGEMTHCAWYAEWLRWMTTEDLRDYGAKR